MNYLLPKCWIDLELNKDFNQKNIEFAFKIGKFKGSQEIK